ncbi:diguanylate cyclase domain-containing protein [Paenibacillus caseinilyticus]|uniref:Diguanylate cyclase n=1 Tax=Paenibacillus mucilaginosus K02 TaxID=997761 RepID=I0BMT3_9BACL|nr:GGDEF domain-containing protein [Paenibacillus mucilaginosus]AFH63680.2 diguanylate cyclase [Paenibacillus mucilaginosus K02]
MIKLRTLLILTITGIVILLTSLLGVLFTRHSTNEIKKEIGHSLAGTAYQMSDKLDNFMWSRAGEMEILTTLDIFKQGGDIPGVQAALDQLQTSFPSFSWVGFMNTEGQVLAATDGILVGTNIASRPVFKEGIKGRFIGDVHEAVLLAKLLPNPTGEPLQFVDISLPVKDHRGRTIGVLAAHMSWEWSREVQRTILEPQLHRSENLELFIVSRTDHTVLLGPEDMVGKPLEIDSVNRAQAGGSGWELAAWPDGRSYLTGYAYGDGYLSYEGLGWTVLVRQPESAAFARVAGLRSDFALAGTLAAMLFAVIGWFLAARITRPINSLTEAADRLRTGEAAELPENRGFREMYILSRSLRSLVESLARTENELGDMKNLAHFDPLTGLPNRVALESYLETTLEEVEPRTETLAFLYLDLDGFKKVNDTLGHHTGDILLQKVAKRLISLQQAGNITVRLGGDEFLHILRFPKESAFEETKRAAEEIIALLNKPFLVDYNRISIGCSIGAAFYPDQDENAGQILKIADECLYRSKRAGKNCVSFSDELTMKLQ